MTKKDKYRKCEKESGNTNNRIVGRTALMFAVVITTPPSPPPTTHTFVDDQHRWTSIVRRQQVTVKQGTIK